MQNKQIKHVNTNKKAESSTKPKAFGAVFGITGMIMLSKIIGFVRNSIVYSTTGVGIVGDAYDHTQTLVSLFTLLFSVGLSSTFIPIYTKEKIHRGFEKANDYANSIFNLYAIIGVIIAVATTIAFSNESFLRLIWPNPELAAMISQMAKIIFPTTVFTAVWGVLVNVLNANEYYIPETFQGIILSVFSIGACLLFGDGISLAIATSIASIFQFLTLLPFLKNRFKYKPILRLRDDNVKQTFLLALPAIITMAFDDINNVSTTMFMRFLPIGSKRLLSLSFTMVVLLQGVFVVPLTTISFSQMSKSASMNDKGGIIRTVKQNTELLALILFPMMLIMILLRKEVITILFQRGNFTPEDTLKAMAPLAFYTLGVFGFALRNFQTRVFYALQKTMYPMIISMVMVVVNIALDFVFVRILDFGVGGLALAISISSIVGAGIMLVALRKLLGKMQIKSTIFELIKIFIATAIALAYLFIAKSLWPIGDVGIIMQLVRFATLSVLTIAAYGVSVYLLKSKALGTISRIVAPVFNKFTKRRR